MTREKRKAKNVLLPFICFALRRRLRTEKINCEGRRRSGEMITPGWEGKIDDVIQIKLKYHYEQAEK